MKMGEVSKSAHPAHTGDTVCTGVYLKYPSLQLLSS